ncbi:Ein3-binding f-box protein 1, partial [Globisporangium splendens]
MQLLSVFGLLCAAVAATVSADGTVAASGTKSWGYKDNDPSMYGPAQWGTQYPTCAGKRQSPIDITVKSVCGDDDQKAPIKFAGECASYKLKQLEDAYKGEVQNGTCTVSVENKAYSMLQFHMHAPSEHTLNGKVFDAEAHFVHTNSDGNALLVVGLFLERKQGATTDPWLTSVWSALSAVNTTDPLSVKLGSYSSLLTAAASKGKVLNYPGSLTTPTCSEIVDWWVLQAPLQVSPADFDKFQAHLEELPATDRGRGARPTQPLNGRIIAVY